MLVDGVRAQLKYHARFPPKDATSLPDVLPHPRPTCPPVLPLLVEVEVVAVADLVVEVTTAELVTAELAAREDATAATDEVAALEDDAMTEDDLIPVSTATMERKAAPVAATEDTPAEVAE
jgi:hypothetical protein